MEDLDLLPPVTQRPTPTPISYRAELKRKAVHLLALVLPLGMVLLGKTWSLYLLVPITTLAVAGDILRTRSEVFARFVRVVFGPLMREEEFTGKEITFNGATYVLLSATLLIFVFPVRLAVPAFVMFMLGDAAAALVGRKVGRHRWPGSTRTIEGTVAFAITGFVVMALFFFFSPFATPLWMGLVSAVVAALTEVLKKPFNDNLRVPMVAALVMYLLEWLVLGNQAALFLTS